MTKALIVLASLLAGLLAGAAMRSADPFWRDAADTIGTLWLNGLRMTVIPLIVTLLVTGIGQTARAANAGRMTARGIVTMIAILWASSLMAALFVPAMIAVFPVPEAAKAALAAMIGTATQPDAVPPFSDMLKAIVPSNIFTAAAADAVLPLIVFTLVFAFAVLRLPQEKRDRIIGLFDALTEAMIMMVGWVLWLAPLGVFALSFGLGQTGGAAALGGLAHYVVILTATGGVIWIASFFLMAAGAGIGPLRFFRASIPVHAVAISTQSSLASLPAMLVALDQLRVRRPASEVILPVAVALFRATGPCMNLGVAIYVAHWLGIEPTTGQIALGAVVAAVTTMSAVSLPGSISFIASIAPICIVMGLPIEPLGILVAIETFPDLMRTLGNVTMDMAVTATVDRRMTAGRASEEPAAET